MLLPLPIGCLLLFQIQGGDAALAARIQQLFNVVLTTDDHEQEAAAWDEAKAIFMQRGLPSAAVVSDETAYKLVWLTCTQGPEGFQRQVLRKAREGAKSHQVPDDAASYCAAHIRQDIVKTKAKKHAPANLALRDQIERLFEADQEVRQRTQFDKEKMSQTDRDQRATLETIFVRYGVPTYRMVGPQAASDFVTMIQHQSAEFRLRVLPRLKANVDSGQADPGSYTKMFDRSQLDAGRKQWYGENLICDSDNPKLHIAPIANEQKVNQRRAAIGLMRLELYAELVAKMTPDLCAVTPGAK